MSGFLAFSMPWTEFIHFLCHKFHSFLCPEACCRMNKLDTMRENDNKLWPGVLDLAGHGHSVWRNIETYFFFNLKISEENRDRVSELIHQLVTNLFVVKPRQYGSIYKAGNPADDPPKVF